MQRCTLHCSNVAGMSFLQRCENNLHSTLYNVVFTLCVCWVPGSIFCVATYIKLLLPIFPSNGADSQLISYMSGGKVVNGTYSWFMRRIRVSCKMLGLLSFVHTFVKKRRSDSLTRG